MNKTAHDKVRVGMLIGLSITVMVTAIVWAIYDGLLDNALVAAVTFIVVGIATFVLVLAGRSFVSDIKAGIPFEDERSRRVKEKAAGNSFLFMIYLLLALGLYCDNVNASLKATDITGISILGGAISFLALWAYFGRKPSLD
jgi:hypothetical protein